MPEIPVYIGRETPLRGEAAFPNTWRSISDRLPGVDLPTTFKPPIGTFMLSVRPMYMTKIGLLVGKPSGPSAILKG